MASKVNERFYAYKNLIAISLTNFFMDTGILPVLNIQTSLFSKNGLGSMSLFCLFLGMVLGSLLTTVLSTLLGYITTISIAIAITFPFFLANLYGTWYTLLPTAFFIGMGFGTLATVTPTYIRDLSKRYASFLEKSETEVFSKFYPLYFSIFKLSQISGNLLVSAVLKLPKKRFERNETICGPDFCPDTILPKDTINVSFTQLLTMVLSVCGITSVSLLIVIVFLDANKSSKVKEEKTKLELIISPLKELNDIRMILLIPIILFAGIQCSFIYGDLTETYITCYFGIDMIGWTMCVFGLSSFLCCMFYSYVCKYVGSFNILICAVFVHLTFLACLLNWNKFNIHVFYPYLICATVGGACDSAWRSILPVFIKGVFQERLNEIFSLVYFLMHLGFCIPVLYGPYVCVKTKIYVNIGFIILGFILASVVHVRNIKWKREWHRVSNE